MSNSASEEEIYTEEKHRLDLEISRINNEVYNMNSSASPFAPPIIITKSDNISHKVDSLCSILEGGQGVLLAGKSNAINKLISIVEITKASCNGNNVYQYNRSTQQSSVNNPNYSRARMTSQQKQNLSNDLKPKTYILPILLVYISPAPLLVSQDWTEQKVTKTTA